MVPEGPPITQADGQTSCFVKKILLASCNFGMIAKMPYGKEVRNTRFSYETLQAKFPFHLMLMCGSKISHRGMGGG